MRRMHIFYSNSSFNHTVDRLCRVCTVAEGKKESYDLKEKNSWTTYREITRRRLQLSKPTQIHPRGKREGWFSIKLTG